MRSLADRLSHEPAEYNLCVEGRSTITALQVQKTRDADVKNMSGPLKEHLEYTATFFTKGYHQQLDDISVTLFSSKDVGSTYRVGNMIYPNRLCHGF